MMLDVTIDRQNKREEFAVIGNMFAINVLSDNPHRMILENLCLDMFRLRIMVISALEYIYIYWQYMVGKGSLLAPWNAPKVHLSLHICVLCILLFLIPSRRCIIINNIFFLQSEIM